MKNIYVVLISILKYLKQLRISVKEIKKYFFILGIGGFTLSFSGCSTPEMTNTKQSGVEQMLLSTATDRAVSKFLPKTFLAGKNVYLDTSNLESLEKGYVTGMVKMHLAGEEAKLVDDKLKADIMVQIYSGALGTDTDSWLLGIPSIPVPIPLAGNLVTPEIAFVKEIEQTGTCKLLVIAKNKKTNVPLFSQPNVVGSSYYNRWTVLGFEFSRKDVYEEKEPTKNDDNSLSDNKKNSKLTLNEKINNIPYFAHV